MLKSNPVTTTECRTGTSSGGGGTYRIGPVSEGAHPARPYCTKQVLQWGGGGAYKVVSLRIVPNILQTSTGIQQKKNYRTYCIFYFVYSYIAKQAFGQGCGSEYGSAWILLLAMQMCWTLSICQNQNTTPRFAGPKWWSKHQQPLSP